LRIAVKYGGKFVGEIVGNTYITYRGIEHYFRKFKGFAISKKVLQHVAQKGVKKVLIVYRGIKGKRRVYESYVKRWLEGESYVFNRNGREDLQLVLPLDEMVVVEDNLDYNDPLLSILEPEKPRMPESPQA